MPEWCISIFSHMGAQAVIYDLTGLFQSQNSFLDINIKPSVVMGDL